MLRTIKSGIVGLGIGALGSILLRKQKPIIVI
jgi:hypothetical protein